MRKEEFEVPIIQCEFLIPLRRDANLSDGDPHAPFAHEWLKRELFARFGGGTTAPGNYEGFYTDPDTGQQVFDESTKYIVAVNEDAIDTVREFLGEACHVFKQKCIYLAVAGSVEFIEPLDDDGSEE